LERLRLSFILLDFGRHRKEKLEPAECTSSILFREALRAWFLDEWASRTAEERHHQHSGAENAQRLITQVQFRQQESTKLYAINATLTQIAPVKLGVQLPTTK
jgi:hypothetical protein